VHVIVGKVPDVWLQQVLAAAPLLLADGMDDQRQINRDEQRQREG
jgi:hypothetical protein